MKLCECKCGGQVKTDKHKFIHGHNAKLTGFKKGNNLYNIREITGSHINCDNCNKLIYRSKCFVMKNKNNFCSKTCNFLFQTGKSNPEHSKKMKEGYASGKNIVWNNGLTKETDERVKLSSEKSSITRKERIKEGKIVLYKNGLNINCLNCKKEFYVQMYRKETARYCSRECAHNSEIRNELIRKNQPIDKIYKENKGSFVKGRKTWNDGLTKENNNIIKLASEKRIGIKHPHKEKSKKQIGNTLREKYKKGELKTWNDGLTKDNDERVKKSSEKMSITNTGTYRTKEQKLNMSVSAIKRIEECKINNLPLTPKIGKYETKILNFYEQATGYKFERQFKIGRYFVDGYCSLLKLAIEVDEKHHKNRLQKDLERQKYIESRLGCTFLRIDIGDL